jgi:copper resistance protein B
MRLLPARDRVRAAALGAALAVIASVVRAQEPPATAPHVAPEPPQQPMPAMSNADMVQTMQMNDAASTGSLLLDQFEWRHDGGDDAAVWEGEAWYGDDYDKLWLRTEGERLQGITEDARVELLWDRIVSRWWSLQTGAREDFGDGPPRSWAALGVQGLAPYWFEVEATAYAGDAGRTAARVKIEYDLRLTQRLVVQPEAEANLYGKADPARQLGAGLADLDMGLRLRYEIRREFAPYLGVAWRRLCGETAAYARAQNLGASELQWVAGLRLWF